MKVYFIGAGPGDPELITIKGFKAIQRSGYCIYAGSLVNKELLNALPSHAKIYDSSAMRLEEMVVVSGVSSFVGAPAALKQELTLPGTTQTIVITRMEGKAPIPEKEHLGKLATTTPTMCIFLSIDKIDEVVKILIPHYGKDCPVAVVYKATWPDQKIVRSKLLDIAEKIKQESIKKSALIIVGWVFEKEFQRSVLYTQGWEKS